MILRKKKPIDWTQESRRFDTVAEHYDLYRPGYPEELVDFILARSQIPPHGKILEIGCGTGKATRLFARRGYAMLCIDPGEKLISIARQNLRDYPDLEFVVSPFEDWSAPEGVFDLVISAQAFHWVPKDTAYARVARVLKPSGYVALFWNMVPDVEGGIYEELSAAYRKYARELTSREHRSYKEAVDQRRQELVESGYFEEIEVASFSWSVQYDTQQFMGLLTTYSDHLRLSEKIRARLLKRIAAILDKHGGSIEKPYLATVFLGRKIVNP